MEDIRLKTADLEIGGKTYTLRCNNNVLADVQEAFGSMSEALSGRHGIRTAMTFLAAMLNDDADLQGWPERFTARTVGRMIPPAEMTQLEATVMELVASAFEAAPDDGAEAEGEAKNA